MDADQRSNSRGFFSSRKADEAKRRRRGLLRRLSRDRSPTQREGKKPKGILVKRESAQWWMPRYEPAKKDVASCEKLRGAASKRRSGDVRMGKPGGGNAPSSCKGSQPGELKHLSTRRKRNQK